MSNDSRNEMEQIHRGLEAFLEQELKEMQGQDEGPQLFDLHETEVDGEQEIKVMNLANYAESSRRRERDDYLEDWDSAEHRSRVARQRQQEKHRRQQDEQRRMQQDRQERSKAAINTVSDGGKHTQQGKAAQADRKERNSRRKRRKRKKSGFRRFLIAVIILIALMVGGVYYVVGAVYDKLHYTEIISVADAPLKEEGVINILLIGNDSRQNGEDGRSDAMILLSVSSRTKKIYMTSLLRDMYVEIPGYKNNRLNAAYSFGGAELLMETVEQNLDITVNRYVLVNFEAFAKLVDAVGGVQLELTGEEIEYVNAYLVEYNMLTDRPQGTDNMDSASGGLVHLNGPQALAYTRNRYLGTDFGRTERQRKVLEAVIRRLPRALVTNPKELVNGLMPNLTTNLTKGECMQMVLTAPTLLGYDLVQSSIPQEGTYSNATIRDMSVLEVDFEANRQFIRENIYGKDR